MVVDRRGLNIDVRVGRRDRASTNHSQPVSSCRQTLSRNAQCPGIDSGGCDRDIVDADPVTCHRPIAAIADQRDITIDGRDRRGNVNTMKIAESRSSRIGSQYNDAVGRGNTCAGNNQDVARDVQTDRARTGGCQCASHVDGVTSRSAIDINTLICQQCQRPDVDRVITAQRVDIERAASKC